MPDEIGDTEVILLCRDERKKITMYDFSNIIFAKLKAC